MPAGRITIGSANKYSYPMTRVIVSACVDKYRYKHKCKYKYRIVVKGANKFSYPMTIMATRVVVSLCVDN